MIGQVIINLCFNAIDEIVLPTTEAKELRVTTCRDGDWACIRVADEGRGMERAPRNQLVSGAFSAKQDGSGLGLIVSEHIVERHGGDIEFSPNEPRGTEVRLRLPIAGGTPSVGV